MAPDLSAFDTSIPWEMDSQNPLTDTSLLGVTESRTSQPNLERFIILLSLSCSVISPSLTLCDSPLLLSSLSALPLSPLFCVFQLSLIPFPFLPPPFQLSLSLAINHYISNCQASASSSMVCYRPNCAPATSSSLSQSQFTSVLTAGPSHSYRQGEYSFEPAVCQFLIPVCSHGT